MGETEGIESCGDFVGGLLLAAPEKKVIVKASQAKIYDSNFQPFVDILLLGHREWLVCSLAE